MAPASGSNLKQIKQQNLALLLKHVAQGTACTRADLARATGLSKMAVTNLVTELLKAGYLSETQSAASAAPGRPPVELSISEQAPLLCGMLIKRGLCQVVLTDLCGTIQHKLTYDYPNGISAADLVSRLKDGFLLLRQKAPRIFPAIGVASIGPLDTATGKLLEPADFYGIREFDILSAVKAFSHLPVFLINDANAGALAETLYGYGRTHPGFIYLHIMNGIGAGLNLDGVVYAGQHGLAGEIGHTSINFSGPLCACGNRGCLDVYANLGTLQQAVMDLSCRYPNSPLCAHAPSWDDVVSAAMKDDPLALSALDVSTVLVGYPAPEGCRAIEDLLQRYLRQAPHFGKICLQHSTFGGDAPLIGASALVADKIFQCELELL